jgi:dipeptidyl aminopeptidase/acylaminoacyl peptidase
MYSDRMPKVFSARLLLCGSALILLLPLAAIVVRSEEPRFPNSEDLRHIKAMGFPSLSPDGTQVLFAITDATADGAKSHIWITPVAGGAARQLTYSPDSDKRGERDAAWAPDGSAIYFLAKRGEHVQLFRLPLAGGEAVPYDLKVLPPVDDSTEPGFLPPAAPDTAGTKKEAKPEPIAIDVSSFTISHDNHWLAIIAADPETPGEKKAKEAKADAVWVNHQRHGERLYLTALSPSGAVVSSDPETKADTKPAKPNESVLKAVTLAPEIRDVSWSPKSDRMLVVTELPNGAGDLGPSSSAWLVNAATPDQPIALKSIPATVRGGVAWNPEGDRIVFAAQTPDDAPPGLEELFALSLPVSGAAETDKPVRLLTNFPGSLSFGESVFLPGGQVLVPVEQGTRMTSVRIALDGSHTPVAITQSTPIAADLSTNLNQTGWVWIASGSDHPSSLCYAAKLEGECRALSIPDLTTEHFRAVQSQLVTWKSDGLTVEGLLYLPAFPEGKKIPLVVDVHGGPSGVWQDRYEEWIGFLIGHGWGVFRPNLRGSSAYGVKFEAANKNDLGGGDYRDLMTGVDAVLKQYPLDPDKLALIGYSYGGEMAGFVEGKTDRFKAIVSGAPVIDQFSEYGTEGGSWYDRWYFGKPWEHVEDAWKQSPLAGVSKAKTPFLLLQGESDSTDPLGQSLEMYRALRQAGAPVELVTYPREDHGPLAQGIFGYPSPEPWHGFDARRRIVEFLQKGFGEKSQ